MKSGVPNWVPQQLLAVNRTGFNEETYFSLSYSAVEIDQNDISGMLCVCSEITHQVLAERRLRIQRDISAAANDANNIEKVFEDIVRVADSYANDLPFTMLYMLENDQLVCRGTTRITIDPEANTPWQIHKAMYGETIVTENVQDFISIKGGIWNEPVRKAIAIPIPSSIAAKPLGVFVAGVNPNTPLDENYLSFYELLAGQISVAVRNALAYEEERKRAAYLAEIDKAKTAFFNNISHEFRTPLTLILGPLRDLLSNQSISYYRSVRDQIGMAYSNAVRLLKLVNTLLDFSRIEAHRMQANYTPVDLSYLTSELASSFESAIKKEDLFFHIDCPTLSQPVYVDIQMWEKIVFNLLSNALKFTFEGGISVRMQETTEEAILTISDTGVGIPAAALPRIFDRFHRVASSRARTHEGTGIGLALTKELINIHGGIIEANSLLNNGTTFTIRIPKGTAHLDAASLREETRDEGINHLLEGYTNEISSWKVTDDEVHTPADKEKDLILVVDDNIQMADYIQKLLSKHWSVIVARDGKEALSLIHQMNPDLVLSDVMMPVMNGFELLRAIRNDMAISDLPVILLSARAGKEATIEGLEKGANDYLIKPFYADELIARVSTQLQLRRSERANIILRESEKKFRTLAESVPEKVWSCNTDGSLIYCNPGMLSYTGMGQHAKGHWLDAIHPDESGFMQEAWNKANADGKGFESECRLRNGNGAYEWHLLHVNPEKNNDGTIDLWIGTFTDIHSRKLFQEELERNVRDRTADLIHTNAELEQFAFAASHDLQEPLRKILIYSEILKNEIPSSQQKLAGYLEKIQTSSSRMRNLINDLLNFSRLSQREVAFVPTDLNDVFDNLIIDLEYQVTSLQASISYTGLPVIDAIPLQIQQLFFNLLSNALKFTDNTRKPAITIHAVTAGPEDIARIRVPDLSTTYVKIVVADNGIGFNQNYAEQIFEMFQKLHHRDSYAGTGIGLALCKKVVINHHGAIYATSIEGQGTTFSIILPSRQPANFFPDREEKNS